MIEVLYLGILFIFNQLLFVLHIKYELKVLVRSLLLEKCVLTILKFL